MPSAGMTATAVATLGIVLAWPAPFVAKQRQASPDGARETASSGASVEPARPAIRLTAIVTDRRGRSIVNLRPGDFELEDNGTVQKLESVVLHRSQAQRSIPAPPIHSAEDERRAATDPDTRVFAFYLDEFHVSAGEATARVREAVTRFIDAELRPHDLVLVLKPLEPLTRLRFTRDREAIRAAVDSFAGRRGDYTALSPFEEQYVGRAPQAVEPARAQIVVAGLRELTMRIGELGAARAAIILVSEGIGRATGAQRRHRLPDLQSLARAAGHYNLPVHTLDPGDAEPTAPDKPVATTGERIVATLEALSAQTGGLAAAGPDALGPALARLARDLDSYYALTYQPPQPTDGRFHPIQVRTKRKDAQVRTRTGYWSPLSAEWREWLDRAATTEPARPVRALRRSPFIETWVGFTKEPGGRLRLVFTWEPAEPPGSRPRSVPHVVALKASTVDGAAIFEQDIEPVRIVNDGDRARDRASFDIPEGRIQLDLVVKRADGTVIDTGAQDVDPPVSRGGNPVILPVQMVRARSARDFRLVTSDPTPTPWPSREFSRTERLLIVVPSYDPGGSAVTVLSTLLNGRGHRLRELPLVASERNDGLFRFDLPLGWLAPGEYGIEVAASSGNGSVRQLVRFRVTG